MSADSNSAAAAAPPSAPDCAAEDEPEIANNDGTIEEYYSKYVPAPDGIEDMEVYTPGGFHPIHLNDTFQNRYTVIHKLGAGGSATVWLARDSQDERYVALKVVSASMSGFAETEVATHKRLRASIGESALGGFVVPLLDDFWIEGPNGRHMCLVQSVCGPSLNTFRQFRLMKIRPDLISGLCMQLVQSLAQLHEAGLVYGDLSGGNVAFALKNLDHLSVEEVLETLGQPESYPVRVARKSDTDWAAKHGPHTVYDSIEFTVGASLDLLIPEVKLIDLGGSYFLPREFEEDGAAFTESYADPSSLGFNDAADQASDIWALACILFEMRSATIFVENIGAGVFSQVLDRIGPLPKEWQDDAENAEVAAHVEESNPVNASREASAQPQSKRQSFMLAVNKITGFTKLKQLCNAVLSWVVRKPSAKTKEQTRSDMVYMWDSRGDDKTLHGQIRNIGNWHPWHKLTIEQRRARLEDYNAVLEDKEDTSDKALDRGPPGHAALSDEEAADFEDLLRKMFTWERSERITIGNVLKHPWFNKKYLVEESGPWLQYYYYGCGYSAFGVRYI
ncbi:Serine/threonine-protein kinase SRPK [Cyphellophora attinorum]|uniref:non-specific serine/threonine protein kinase n=1 Tax=Cyphellophora attinorum TaxID=1664694 RepID=A0A0N0NM27_9EURO|nr:Serine/threonine-protein kinase SRPK [Phialophora attinorum]KPI39719.1 Serine/threonine-protein kinase SRPK [Phialophora attinorum]